MFALHLLPSGIFYPHVTNILGPGVALNMTALLKELEMLRQRGVPEPILRISDRAQVVLPYHVLLDEYEEARRGDRQFGSTKQGMAPFYADKYLKLGVQVADLFDETRLRSQLDESLAVKNVLFKELYHQPMLSTDDLAPHLLEAGQRIRAYVEDTVYVLQEAWRSGQRILLEGQLGALRDPDHGIHPYPTSSSPLAGFASVGAGIPPYAITTIVAVAKAYSTCVGAGPFVTELQGAAADELRRRGGADGEFGATTGRPRRVGYFDAVATRYGCMVQGATDVALTLVDVLGYLDEIPVCTAYDIEGDITTRFPSPGKLERAKPVWERLRGWKCDISGARTLEDLPPNARAYIDRIQTLLDIPISWVSVGPKREQMIVRHP
jgi:adenylosuccinate synthase